MAWISATWRSEARAWHLSWAGVGHPPASTSVAGRTGVSSVGFPGRAQPCKFRSLHGHDGRNTLGKRKTRNDQTQLHATSPTNSTRSLISQACSLNCSCTGNAGNAASPRISKAAWLEASPALSGIDDTLVAPALRRPPVSPWPVSPPTHTQSQRTPLPIRWPSRKQAEAAMGWRGERGTERGAGKTEGGGGGGWRLGREGGGGDGP